MLIELDEDVFHCHLEVLIDTLLLGIVLVVFAVVVELERRHGEEPAFFAQGSCEG